MVWNKEDPWEERYRLAKQYYTAHGDLNISPQYVVNNIWLGKWVYEQRKNKGKLSPEQTRRLESIGMDWRSKNERAWDKNYTVAKHYYAAHGNVNIPQSYKTDDGATLGLWIYRQKQNLGKHVLNTEQVQKLEQVGITADV